MFLIPSEDQLLIGVILLSIVVFLLPSLFMFYLCFAAAWLLVLLLHGALGLLVVLCNEQPICWMLLADRWHHGPILEQVGGKARGVIVDVFGIETKHKYGYGSSH